MKKQKPLTKEKYLKQFSRAVRWRLPPQESEEAIADYRELIFQEEREESRLVEELGTPVQAAHLLTDVKAYRRWLAVFAVLAFGLFLLVKWAWTGIVRLSLFDVHEAWFPVWVMVVGLLLSLYWFRRHGQKSGPMSRRLVLALAAGLLFLLGFAALYWYALDPQNLPIYTEHIDYQIYYESMLTVCCRVLVIYGGILWSLAAFAGLVLAKCYDRRWLALYALGLTIAATFGFVELNMLCMDLTYHGAEAMRAYLFIRILPIDAVGLIGTGVALC